MYSRARRFSKAVSPTVIHTKAYVRLRDAFLGVFGIVVVLVDHWMVVELCGQLSG